MSFGCGADVNVRDASNLGKRVTARLRFDKSVLKVGSKVPRDRVVLEHHIDIDCNSLDSRINTTQLHRNSGTHNIDVAVQPAEMGHTS